MTIDVSAWGPSLHAYLSEHWRAQGITANAWAETVPGINTASISRWGSGTAPTLQAFLVVAEALGMPVADLLVAVGIADADPGRSVVRPAAPNIDVAIAGDPDISPALRDALRNLVAAWREVESGATDTVRSRRASRKRT